MEENKKNGMKIIKKILIIWAVIQGILVIVMQILKIKGKKREASNNEREIKEYYAYMNGKRILCEDDFFKSMILRSVMGGIDIDLTNTTIRNDSFITINSIMSGISIKVPENVNVKVDGNFKMSGVSNTVPEYLDEKTPTLYVAAKSVMSGIAVKVCDNTEDEDIFAE